MLRFESDLTLHATKTSLANYDVIFFDERSLINFSHFLYYNLSSFSSLSLAFFISLSLSLSLSHIHRFSRYITLQSRFCIIFPLQICSFTIANYTRNRSCNLVETKLREQWRNTTAVLHRIFDSHWQRFPYVRPHPSERNRQSPVKNSRGPPFAFRARQGLALFVRSRPTRAFSIACISSSCQGTKRNQKAGERERERERERQRDREHGTCERFRRIKKKKKRKGKNEQVKPGSKGPYRVQRKIKAVIEETEGNGEGNARTEKKKRGV